MIVHFSFLFRKIYKYYNPDLSIYSLIKKIFKYLHNYHKFKEHYHYIIDNIK